MMTGKLYINGIDIYKSFGLYSCDQGYNSLIQWASLKDVPYNDWYEENGIEPDLSEPVVDSRTCTLHLAGRSSDTQIWDLLSLVSNGATPNTIEVAEIGRTFSNLVYLNASEPKVVDDLWQIDLSFVDDCPVVPAIGSPQSNVASYNDYAIDGRLFTDYGVRILAGTRSSLAQIPARKTNWEYSSEYAHGTISGNNNVGHTKAYEATLRCLMRADSLTELWNNYDALYAQLVSAGEHHIDATAIAKRYPCYYRYAKVKRFYASDKIWMEFDITVNIYTTPINL